MSGPFRLSLKFTFVGLLVAILGALCIPVFLLLYHSKHSLDQLQAFCQENAVIFLCWRLALIATLFFLWPVYIRYRTKKHKWPVENIPKLIALRYGLVVLLLALDLLFQYSAVG